MRSESPPMSFTPTAIWMPAPRKPWRPGNGWRAGARSRNPRSSSYSGRKVAGEWPRVGRSTCDEGREGRRPSHAGKDSSKQRRLVVQSSAAPLAELPKCSLAQSVQAVDAHAICGDDPAHLLPFSCVACGATWTLRDTGEGYFFGCTSYMAHRWRGRYLSVGTAPSCAVWS